MNSPVDEQPNLFVPLEEFKKLLDLLLKEFVQSSGLINHFNHQTFETAISNLNKEGYIAVDFDDLISLTAKGRSRVRQFFENDFPDPNSHTLNTAFDLESEDDSSTSD